MKKPTYTDLSDEDKVLMGALFDYKEAQKAERAVLRSQIEALKIKEMNCTKEIMNLSTCKISEKFDILPHSAKPLSAKDKKRIADNNRKRIGIMPASQRAKMEALMVKSRARNKESLFNVEIPVLGGKALACS